MAAIPPNMELTDRRGVRWMAHPTQYQDDKIGAPGWLELISSEGERLGHSEVVNLYGLTDRPDNPTPYLIARYVYS